MSPATWGVLDGLPLCYTIMLQRLYLPHLCRPLKAPCLTYSVRSSARWLASCYYLRWFAQWYTEAPLLCPDPYPADATHLDVTRHRQELPAACLGTHTPVTENDFAQVLAQIWMDSPEIATIGQAQTSY